MKRLIHIFIVLFVGIGAFLLGRTHAPHAANLAPNSPQILYYVDPMHPAYRSDKPGVAPDCGMDLVPVYAKSLPSLDASGSSSTVSIDAAQQNMIGMKTEIVGSSSGSETITVPGRVAVDDSRLFRINAAVDGWMRTISSASIGSHVRKDETLAAFYSPDFVGLEQGYLVATERMGATTRQLAAPGTQSTSARLRNYGMGEPQIAEIAATRQMPENVNIVSPANGFIIARNVAIGQRFDKGVELYRIADLSHVWILAEVAESQAQYLHPGMTVDVKVPGGQRQLNARVSNVLPQVDPNTRTTSIRLEASNPGYQLRPDMFVDLQIKVKTPAGLEVPVDALLDAGNEQRVYVQQDDGTFTARAVKTGMWVGDRVEIIRGLKAGERVVVAGAFLLDSETRLKSISASPHDLNRSSRAADTSAPLHSGGQL